VSPPPDVVVPRWEWRTFGESFAAVDARLAVLPPEREQESDEVYVVSSASDASVKVRDGLLDIKKLLRIDEHGFEQWTPLTKAGFPLSRDDALTALVALGIEAPDLARGEYTAEQLFSEVVEERPELRAVEVYKKRQHYTVAGAMAELSEVRTALGDAQTIAVESEDPARVRAGIEELGLEPGSNVSLPRWLKEVVGLGGRRFGVIDVGTNSVKFHIGERLADGTWRTIVDRAEVTRLGEGLANGGELQPEPFERTVAAIADMVAEARRNGVEAMAAVGTAGLRQASNSAKFVEAVRERTGVEVEVIPGEEEGRLAYLAVRAELDVGEGSLVVFDTGGGSSQFTFGRGDAVEERFSVNVGAARFTERFGLDGPVADETLAAAREAIAADLSRLDGRPAPDALVGMGGAITNLAAVKLRLATYDPDAVQGTHLDAAEIDRQIERYRSCSAEERREIVGLQPKRAEVILAGALIVGAVLAKLGSEWLTVSDRGLRHGLLTERFGA
jgi:exopolyphosphatase/guanosine-5'-triphosphate,3'-diphosphate pyrophosphatase